MKKVFSLLAVLAVTVFMASSVWAALPEVQKAYATFAAEALEIGFDLYTYDSEKTGFTFGTDGVYKDSDKATTITFDLSTVDLGVNTESFARGAVFARVTSNLKKQKAGTTLYMYTKNKDNSYTGDYKIKYTDPAHSDGLIRKTNSSTYAAGDNAPIEMQFKLATEATTYPTEMLRAATSGNEKYLLDKASTDYSAVNVKIGQSGVGGGIWGGKQEDGQTDWYSEDKDMIIFFGAWFNNVFAGDEYGTETINIVTSAE